MIQSLQESVPVIEVAGYMSRTEERRLASTNGMTQAIALEAIRHSLLDAANI